MHETDSGIPLHLAQATLTVDLAAIAANWRLLRDTAAPAECAAVVKADAYGTGSEQVARALAAAGCRTFFVAHASEAIRLRRQLSAPEFRIYVLNGLAGGDNTVRTKTVRTKTVRAMRDHDLRPVICCMEDLQLWLGITPPGHPANIGLQFSTGMNRLGFFPADAAKTAQLTAGLPGLTIDFVMSHFVSSEITGDPLNDQQIADFASIRVLFPSVPASLANSSGIFLPQAPHYDLVRPGYALFGGNPLPGRTNPMQHVVRLQAPVLQVRHIQTGETAGYNGVWKAQRKSTLAIIGVGYADGFLRSAGGQDNPAHALIGGVPCPVAGRVSMDLLILDATDAPPGDVRPGAMAELLGSTIGIDDLAARCGTIGYEILTNLGCRYHRTYTNAL